MGSANAFVEAEYIETGTEREYVINHTRTESDGQGNVRIFCYTERRKNQFILAYVAFIPARQLATIARRGMVAATNLMPLVDAVYPLEATH